MKKIPTLFIRKFENGKVVGITPEVTPGMEWVLKGEGHATVKHDGACCAIINYLFYKRYDAKKGKPVPEGAIKCQDAPDPVTGHFPCWVRCQKDDPADKWFFEAISNYSDRMMRQHKEVENGTYEAIGPHFNGNPYELKTDTLVKHGNDIIIHGEPRTFEEIKEFLRVHKIEGLVYWLCGEPMCKIKRTDFGFAWPPEDE